MLHGFSTGESVPRLIGTAMILDEAALGLRGFKGGHAREQRAHTTPASLLIEGGVLLGRFLRERIDK